MINKKTKIDWTDFTWNPITGCLHNCQYCYARTISHRFSGDIRLNLTSKQIKRYDKNCYILEKPFKSPTGAVVTLPVGFAPTLHEYRLEQPAQRKKPANIFVGSMSDIFGRWVLDEWIDKIFEACAAAPWHNYMFLTKNPTRYAELAAADALPMHDNMWYGSTVTTPEAYMLHDTERLYHTFVSVEPILQDFSGCRWTNTDWVIVGAETGYRPDKVTPKREWIENIVREVKDNNIPLFIKDSKEMRAVVGNLVDKYREFPEQLKRD